MANFGAGVSASGAGLALGEGLGLGTGAVATALAETVGIASFCPVLTGSPTFSRLAAAIAVHGTP